MESFNKMDVLFIGAGPASLAGAIKLKRQLNEAGRKESVVVVEKAEKAGQHNLSGAVFEAGVLDNLIPDWKNSKSKFVDRMLASEVKTDDIVYLRGEKNASRIPDMLVPGAMRHHGNYVVSVSELVSWLSDIAQETGVEIYHGFAAKEVIVENGKVRGVRLGEKGLNKEKARQDNYIPGEVVEAKVTVFGEGSAGQLAQDLINKGLLRPGKNPQIYSLGVKEIIRLPENNKFGNNRVMHTLGYPLPADVFGGGTIYSMPDNLVAVALIMSLDWRYCNLNPQEQLQIFKSHPYIKPFLENGRVLAYGAKTLPEGGYYALSELYSDGALVIGDDAGLTNVKKLKGLHYAVQSGILAAEALFQAIEAQDFSKTALRSYRDRLDKSFIIKEMRGARNYRQVFTKGRLHGGVPLSFIQSWLPVKLGTKPDFEAMKTTRLNRTPQGGIDRLTAVSLSGTMHREDEPSHITFKEEGMDDSCFQKYGCHPCESFCPAGVYKFEDDKLILSPSNCVHCQTCRLKCPNQVINWEVPEGGDGPKYKLM